MSALDAVDATERVSQQSADGLPSQCTIIIDTNPQAWSVLADTLPIANAVASIVIFVNAHLAFNNANRVALIGSHTNRAVWLYPTSPSLPVPSDGDVEMADANANANANSVPSAVAQPSAAHAASKYPPFAQVERSLLAAIRSLVSETRPAELAYSTTTQMSGALTLALTHINKTSLSLTAAETTSAAAAHSATGAGGNSSSSSSSANKTAASLSGLHARILVLSVSDSGPGQYIPIMNSAFAAAHAGVAIDTLALLGRATFLEQASFITRGTHVRVAEPRGLLQYLMFGFSRGIAPAGRGSGPARSGLPIKKAAGKTLSTMPQLRSDASVAELLVRPSADAVDFRAACFCHRDVVDTGFVCSICLSIFCGLPPDGECLTCGTRLALGVTTASC